MATIKITCCICGGEFTTAEKGKRTARTCSHRCRAALAGTTFAPGQRPWNKGQKGIHLSPSTEFKPGPRPELRDPVGTVKIRQRHNRPDPARAFVKVADPNVWRLRSLVAWEAANGPIPPGLVIHHLDGDCLNDALTNLAAISRAAHLAQHRDKVAGAQRGRKHSPEHCAAIAAGLRRAYAARKR